MRRKIRGATLKETWGKRPNHFWEYNITKKCAEEGKPMPFAQRGKLSIGKGDWQGGGGENLRRNGEKR